MYVGNEPLCFGADEQQFCVLALKNEAVTLATSNAAVVFFPTDKVHECFYYMLPGYGPK